MLWCTWPPMKLQKLLLSSCGKLLSDQGANFESNTIRELCKLIGIWKVRTSPYHAQTKGQIEQAYQTVMCRIGKLSKNQKVDWLKHFPKLVHAYNSMTLAITGYSLHYFMFGCQSHFPLTSVSPWWWVWKNTSVLTTMSPNYVNNCGKPLKRLKCSPYQRWRDRSSTMIGNLMPFWWNQVTWYWLKLMPTGGGGKWRTSGRRNHMK